MSEGGTETSGKGGRAVWLVSTNLCANTDLGRTNGDYLFHYIFYEVGIFFFTDSQFVRDIQSNFLFHTAFLPLRKMSFFVF